MKRLGVISDTHGRLDPRALASLAAGECEVIVHAGDIGDPEVLRELEALASVYAVLGNNDFDEYGKAVGRFARFSLEGVRFLVAHYPRDGRVSPRSVAPGEPIPQVCIHGHTHVPEIVVGKDAAPATMIFCPGSAFRPRCGSARSLGFIDVEEGRIRRAWVETLDGTTTHTWPNPAGGR